MILTWNMKYDPATQPQPKPNVQAYGKQGTRGCALPRASRAPTTARHRVHTSGVVVRRRSEKPLSSSILLC